MKIDLMDLIGVTNMQIYHLIDQLVEYGLQKQLIHEEDCIYVQNQLLEKFGLQDYQASNSV